LRRLLFTLLTLIVFATALAQTAPKPGSPQALIIGKWWSQASGGRIEIQFTKDGHYSSTYQGQTTPGTYRWLDDKNVMLNDSQRVGIEVSADTLIMVIGAERSKFERVKAPPPAKK
jgi:hypothetical protein